MGAVSSGSFRRGSGNEDSPPSRSLCNEIGISRGEARRGEREREDLYLKIGCHKKKKVGWSERMKKEEEEEQICLPTHSETT